MIKFAFKTVLILVISLVFAQCNNDDDANPGGGPDSVGDCFISWKLDGIDGDFEPSICLYNDNTLNLGIAGEPGFLQVNNLTSPGTFEFGDANLNAILIITTDDGAQLGAEAGTITVTEISNSKAKGTFSATVRDVMDWMQTGPTREVTNGVFEANF